MVLHEYTYVFAIGTCFALLEAYNNGANDVANAWATSVSSRSVTYRQAMLLCLVFEMTGALAVGARTASTIKNGIIPIEAFDGNAGVQLLAFACASAGAAIWVMWCTRNSAHVSSTYSLVSSIAGVGVAAVGASNVEWGWSGGSGLGAIFAGLAMAPAISALFAATIFMLVKLTVHLRTNPVPWAVWTSPFFFLIAGTICTLSIVYKGSPRLGLAKKPPSFIAGVSLGTGFGLALLSALFFVPYVHAKVIKKDNTLRWFHVFQGPLLFRRPAPPGAEFADVPDYAVMKHGGEDDDEENQDGPEQGIKGDIAVVALTICLGFITYGYNIMKVMGNKITYHSPSRGSSMEMGAAITILIFSQYSLPVSTSMCITGATVGVGLCNGTFKAVNWQRVGLLMFSWIMTIPIAGAIGGLLMALAVNTPSFA
ncbi:hypothetical protein BN1723_014239 [Verticillium longisporum]|uniref:Phosphate transporter n=1 Tax=Verticillium longisporum TaxID=100787 RepID=A0A0G4M4G8_VERLO|nr:hypothetical protein BN1723_014239 [Verticillium longisporum]